MKILLGVLMVIIVSGDDETITGILEDSVLLPCNCSERDLNKEFKWQMEEPEKMLVLRYNNTLDLADNGTYEGRVKVFLNESHNNCSVLLTNITAGDQGIYRCIFYSQELYKSLFVNLTLSASYNVCLNLNADLSVKVYHCDVNGRYRDTVIQWNLDGQLLTNSPTTNITNTYTLNARTGLYHFHSELSTNLNTTSEPTCDVKAKGISTIISHDCGAVTRRIQKNPEYIARYLKIIPIMLVLGLSLVLWRRWKSSQRLQRIREVETNNSYC